MTYLANCRRTMHGINQRVLKASTSVVVIAALSAGTLSGCSEQEEVQTQARLQPVTTLALTKSDSFDQHQTYTGVIRSANTTGIGFELGGKLDTLLVDSGDSVTQGQILAKLDTSLLLAEQKQLKATLKQTQSDLDLAINNLDRVVKLSKQNYASEQQLDESEQRVQSLKASKQSLEANLDSTSLRIEKSTLVAPFSGIISKRQQNLGEVVNAGTPVFTLIGQHNQLAYIGVPVDVAQTLRTNQQVDVTVGKHDMVGLIAGISGEVDTVTRTVQLRIALDPKETIINGEIAYLDYQQTMATQGYWVPISALTDGVRGLWNVFVVKQGEQGQTVTERRDVEIIYTDDTKAFIKGAIDANELLVVEGLHKLVAGQQVSPTPAEAL
ncbi:efflux RND transporter periplasmic adaptor subunit [Shewanella sp. WXL01]|uniref:efflux RND transporter periplasmic adaptor subunit n=1 Tax=Shewanella sp. WXL01 TaxID=2709721 RepID=UPI001FD8ED02|nr:efflux RND transporter periplasmic adaptor subunit [Shewanella sp. WXL01]